MSEKLKQLYATLCHVETKGINTITMGDCLKFLQQCIAEAEIEEKKSSKE